MKIRDYKNCYYITNDHISFLEVDLYSNAIRMARVFRGYIQN